MSNLPKTYQSSHYAGRAREVALFIDGDYVTRGPWYDAINPARDGFRGWNGTIPTARLTFQLDRRSDNVSPERDAPDLCWGNASLSASEFLAWANS